MSRNLRYKVIGVGEDCVKCGHKMERRAHKEISPQLLKKPYYFSEWDKCLYCAYFQHYERFKIHNPSQTSKTAPRND